MALLRRTEHPGKDRWALPGGFVGIAESLHAAPERVLATKLGLSGVFIEQLYTLGSPDRDPRTRAVTVACYGLVSACIFRDRIHPEATLASVDVAWSGEEGGPVHLVDADARRLALAFDHEDIISSAVKRLRGKLNYAPIDYQLLPPTFTLRRLQAVHECVLSRRMLASAGLQATGELETEVGHRPAELYRFVRESALYPLCCTRV